MSLINDTSTSADTFGRRLQRIRAARGLTQAELAAGVGKSRQTVNAWENGAVIERGDVDLCAQILLCSRSDPLALAEARVPPDPFWSRIKKRLQRMAAESRQRIKLYATGRIRR